MNLNYGQIICKAKLVDCKYMGREFIEEIKNNLAEYILGDYKIGRYAWILKDIQVLNKKIPAKGKLNHWDYNN